MIHTILSGSSRNNSSSFIASKGLERLLIQNGAEKVNLIDFVDYDIPFFNGGDIELDKLTPFQLKLIDAMAESHSIIMVTPEYNWFPSAELVNLMHRLGDKTFLKIWENKVFSFVGVSSGRGGRMPTVQLGYVVDKLINVFNAKSITNPKSFEVQFAKQVLAKDGGSMGNAEFDKGFQAFIDYLNSLVLKWNQ